MKKILFLFYDRIPNLKFTREYEMQAHIEM